MSERTKPLEDWLEKHHATRLWSAKIATGELSCYVINANAFLVTRHAKDHGWDIFTSCGSIEVADTLADAEARLLPAQALPETAQRALAYANGALLGAALRGGEQPFNNKALHELLAVAWLAGARSRD
jgi:hypothetical protein